MAALLGGVRVPVTGRTRGDQPDILHPRYALEVKSRRRVPLFLGMAMAQAKAALRGEQRPVVVIHQTGQHHSEDLVVLRLEDFLSLVPS